jgi:hypothetical protein
MLKIAALLFAFPLLGAPGSCGNLDVASMGCSSDSDCQGLICCNNLCATTCLLNSDGGGTQSDDGGSAGQPDSGVPNDQGDSGVPNDQPDSGVPNNQPDSGTSSPDSGVPTGNGSWCDANVSTCYGAPVNFQDVITSSDIVVADFNQDGIPDFVKFGMATYEDPDAGVILICGDDGGSCYTTPVGGDGAVVYYGTADGGVVQGPSVILDPNTYGIYDIWSGAVGDFNADGWPDLALAGFGGAMHIAINGRDGTFAETDLSAGPSFYEVHVGDFNGDGLPDLAGCGWLGLFVFFNQGGATPSFSDPVHLSPLPGWNDGGFREECTGSAVGDFNGDGYADIASIEYDDQRMASPPVGGGSTLMIHFADGDGGFLNPVTVEFWSADAMVVAGYPSAMAVADINGDGLPDLVGATGDPGVAVFLNVDGGLSPEIVTLAAQGIWRDGDGFPYSNWGLTVADLDGDGSLDVATTASPAQSLPNGGGVLVFFGGETGSFASGQLMQAGIGHPQRIAAWTPTGAVLPSLVVGDESTAFISVLPNVSLLDGGN